MGNIGKKFTKDDIRRITFGISSLDQGQREEVRDFLLDMLERKGGTLYSESLHMELLKLQNKNVISEIDRDNLENALFGD